MKFNLDEALGLNEGIKFSALSRPALEDAIWEILDNCITHSIADEFYTDTGLDPEFDSLDEFTRDELENMVRMLDDKGYNDEQFYLDREAGIDWEPGKYHKFYESIGNKDAEKPETMTTIETDSNSIKTWKLDSVKRMDESADEDWIYLFPELTEEDKKALEDYDLKFLGRNYFEGEVNEVIAGTRGDLERYAKHYLDYVLHPLYLYEPGTFAGDIVKEESLKEGKAEIYDGLESEYISALKKAEDDGVVTFSVKLSEDDEDPAEFDSFEAAKKFAIEHNIDKVHVSDFAYCWGYYCDGEYDEYDERDIAVNEKLEERLKEDINRSDISEEIEKWAKDDFEQGLTFDPDDYDEFKHLLIDNHPELEQEPDESFKNWFDYYFEMLDNLRSGDYFDVEHAEEFIERNPHGYYNSENDYGDYDDLDEKLIQGKSDATLEKNIKTEIEAGKDPKQAYAIAKSIQDKHIGESKESDNIVKSAKEDTAGEDIPVGANEDEPYLDLSQEIEYDDGNEIPEVDLKFSEYVDDEPIIDYENENFNEKLETAKTEEEKKQIEAEIKETEKEIDHAEDHNDPDTAIELHTHLDMLQEDSEPVVDYINENIKANPEEAQAVNLDEVK